MKIPMEWQNKIQANPEQQTTAELRFEICVTCTSYVQLARPECGECGCYIEHKIYSGNEMGCPLNKWYRNDK
jgi:hypothetical protein